MKKIYTLFIIIISFSSFSQEAMSFKKNDSIDNLLKTAEALSLKNDMYKALEYAFKAVSYAQELQDNYYISSSYMMMGTIQHEIVDYKSAKQNLLKSLEYAEKTERKLLLPAILHSLANIYYDDNKDYKNALTYYKRAFELTNKELYADNYQITLHCLIWTLMDLNRFEDAKAYLKIADSIEKTIPDSLQIDRSSFLILKARSLNKDKKIVKAEAAFNESLEQLEKESYWVKGKSYFYNYRSQMYENAGDFFKATQDLKKLLKNERKIFENTRTKHEEITKFRFKVDEYERELEAAKREKALLLDIDKNNKTIIFISSIALLLLAGIVFFYYRGYQSKKKISQILEVKNAELYEAKSEAEQLSKIKSQFISTISHELRTPLYGVVGISSILMENETNSEKDKKLFNSLKFSADYLLDLVNKVLKISKIDSEKKELIKTPTDLFTLSQNILQSFEYQAQKKENELILEHHDQIPKLVNIDALRISEILINLIGNAIKFTEKGTIWLRIKLISTQQKTIKIRYEVEDTGVGVPESQKEYIFEEFSQIGSVYDNKQGTGLGLSIVKNLVQVMESQIHFESKKDIGSIFYFDLDVEASENTEDQKGKQDNPEKEDVLSAKILVAEDNKVNQLVTKNLLKNIGCDCRIVENGIEAVKILKKERFDLVLMDINMPVLDGMQATLEIRKFDTTTPIIALTASELSEVANDCKKAGMNDLINKPLNKKDLRYAIEQNLTVKSSETNT
ncbi:response regulator [Aquimarina sp. M1]